ncbi:hypothetical protein ACH5RR_009102 [Cinchona calisaya]|uniref:Uncharacterized protein n=1 Tax=Cinchona calisaya TaxID=153742 RepID=A0ABD3AGT9_9GENT
MDTKGFLYFQRAINQEGHEYIHDLEYTRSQSLSQIDIEVSIDGLLTQVKEVKVRFGNLIFDPKDENEAIKFKNVLGQIFDTLSLVPVNNNPKENLDHKVSIPRTILYSGVLAKNITVSQTRLVFRSEQHVEYYSNLLEHSSDMEFLDTNELSLDNFEFLLSIRYASLPIRASSYMWIEPYYPSKFAQQFGFDQGVPDNDLEFSVIQRNNYHISHLAIVQRRLFRSNTHARFFYTFWDRMGDRTWWYYKWLSKSSQPYLGYPINKIFRILSQKVLSSNKPFYVTTEIKEIPAGSFKGAIKPIDCDNTADLNNPNSTNARKGSDLSNTTFFSSSPETEHTTSFTDLTDQTTGPSAINEPSKIQTKEVSLIDMSKKMVTNLEIEVDKFSRDFIIGSFQAIVKLMISSNLSELLKSQEAISKHLMRLNRMVLDDDTG